MKRTIHVILVTAMVYCSTSVLALEQAQASAPADQLAALLAGQASNQTVQSIEQILNLKQKLEQGKKADILTTLAQTVAASQIPSGQAAAALPQVVSGNKVSDVLQQSVQTELIKEVSSVLAPYKDSIQALTQLFGQTKLEPSIATGSSTSAPVGAPSDYSKVLSVMTTAYGPGTLDNGHWGNYDYFGNPLHQGIVAVDPAVIPMGTKLWIPGYGYGIANDQGSAIKGNHIDLFFPNRQDALDYGIKNVQIYVLK
ncbi:MAG: 3D domain-containing protein [Sporomusaceae bacterium]|nr:3D domain-containing protein [Sporomusaceae bacterium]